MCNAPTGYKGMFNFYILKHVINCSKRNMFRKEITDAFLLCKSLTNVWSGAWGHISPCNPRLSHLITFRYASKRGERH